MQEKTKILIGILAAGIVFTTSWWVWNYQIKSVDCFNITSANNLKECIGKKVEVAGILECEKTEISTKTGVHYLKFGDGGEIKFLQEYPDCKNYDMKEVKVIGELYQCKTFDQCEGIGLKNIESVNLSEEIAESEERVNEVFIKHRSGGFAGEIQEWRKINKEGNDWIMEICENQLPEEEKILCCEVKITEEDAEKLLNAVKNTEISENSSPVITDVFSHYEIFFRTSQREIWTESRGSMGEEGWNVISQTTEQRELFQMSGDEILRAISNLSSCEKKNEREKIEWEISQPLSLLIKYLPSELEELVSVQNEAFSFSSIQVFDKKAEDFGIVDSFTKKWLKKETSSEQVIVPDVEISILAFKDKSSFEKFPTLAISVPAGSAPITENVEAVNVIKGIEGLRYIFYGPKPKELMEPFDIGDITLFVLTKDNILFRIRGNQNLRSADSTVNAELVLKSLKLEEKSPSYIWEDQKIDFQGSSKEERISADAENCLKLGKRVEIFMCIDNTAKITGDSKVCDIYKRSEFKDLELTFIETCYIFAGVGREDSSVCDSLKTYTKDQCLSRYNIELTKEKNDPDQCGGDAECLEHFVKITGDLEFCGMIIDKFSREWCYRDHATTIEECYKIVGSANPSRDYCIERLAIQNDDQLLCDKIDDSYKLGEIIKNRCKNSFGG